MEDRNFQDAYHHKPLRHPTQEIRLFLLNCNSDSTVTGNMISSTLTESPTFYALSYVWGKDAPSNLILVNSKAFLIRDNMYDALRRLRDFSGDEICCIWIDALCIDQTNIPERNAQVTIMKNIYTRAQITLIWLGELPDEVKHLEDVFQRVSKSCAKIDRINHHRQRHGPRIDDTSNLEEPSQEQKDPQVTSGSHGTVVGRVERRRLNEPREDFGSIMTIAGAFLRTQWWQRIWVVQEFVNSQTDVFIWGSHAFDYLNMWNHFQREESSIIYHWPGLEADFQRARSFFRWQTQQGGLFRLLCEFRRMEATDKHDRIIALLGLVDIRDSTLSMKYIDYCLSPVSLYTHVAQSVISHTQSLSILAEAWGPWQSIELPSWVPNWAIHGSDDGYRLAPYQIWKGAIPGSPYVGLEPLGVSVRYTKAPDVLWLQGFEIDQIEPLLNSSINTAQEMQLVSEVGELWDMVKTNNLVLERYKNPLVAYVDTILASSTTDAHLTTQAGDEFAKNKVHHLADWLSLEGERAEPRLTVAHPETVDVRRHFPYRKVIALASGWLCLVPHTTKAGDLLFFASGACAPYIVRYCEERQGYIFVGECYVHGVMDGELLADIKSGRLQGRKEINLI